MSKAGKVSAVAVLVAVAWAVAEAQPPIRIGASLSQTGAYAAPGMALTILPELPRFSAKNRFIIYDFLLTVMIIIRPQGLVTRVPTGDAPGQRRAASSV